MIVFIGSGGTFSPLVVFFLSLLPSLFSSLPSNFCRWDPKTGHFESQLALSQILQCPAGRQSYCSFQSVTGFLLIACSY